MADVFVSYARADKARVAPIVAAIEQQGWSVWWDPEIDPGQEFDEQIEAELAAARAVLVVWTPASVTSRWVRGEAREAVERGVLVPVRFEQAHLPMDVRSIHTTDIDGWRDDPASPQAREFLRALARLIGRPEMPAHAMSPPRSHEVMRAEGNMPMIRRLAMGVGVLAAIAVFIAVISWLRPERGNPPAPETQVASAAGGPSIAVLPFADMSAAKDQEYFADGLSEELLNLLAKTEGLKVIGRTSSFQFKGRNEDLRMIGEVLGVAHILEGSVRKSGERLRITAQLIRASDGSHVWSDSYDRNLDDIFATQEEIATAVVGALKLKLVGLASDAHAARRDPEAYDRYLQGRFHLERRTESGFATALEYFKESIRHDPQNAIAWVGLANTYFALRNSSLASTLARGVTDEHVRAATQRAIELDPELAQAHLSLGNIQFFYDWDWPAADASLHRALELAPRDPRVLGGLAYVYANTGRYALAVSRFQEAIALDPLAGVLRNGLAHTYLLLGQWAEAEVQARRYLALTGNAESGQFLIAVTLLKQGKLDDAERALADESGEGWKLIGLAIVNYMQGQKKESDANLEALMARFGDHMAFQIAEVYAARGEANRSFEWLDRAFRQRDPGLATILTSEFVGSIQHDPRFGELLAKLGLPYPRVSVAP